METSNSNTWWPFLNDILIDKFHLTWNCVFHVNCGTAVLIQGTWANLVFLGLPDSAGRGNKQNCRFCIQLQEIFSHILISIKSVFLFQDCWDFISFSRSKELCRGIYVSIREFVDYLTVYKLSSYFFDWKLRSLDPWSSTPWLRILF